VARAKAEALRFVNYRMRTRKELVRKLSTRGWPDRVIQAVVTRLEELEMVDDARFARLWIDERMRNKPMGQSLLRRELKSKGIDETIIHAAMEQWSGQDQEKERAGEILRRQSHRYARLDRKTAERRMIAFLARRGFGYADINDTVRCILDEWEKTSN